MVRVDFKNFEVLGIDTYILPSTGTKRLSWNELILLIYGMFSHGKLHFIYFDERSNNI